MTSAITIGRFGLDIDTLSLSAWVDSGDQVQVSGVNWALGVDEGRAIRQQVLGLASTPNDPVYVSSTDDPHRNGFYRVTATDVTSEALLISDGQLSWNATLVRPLNFSALRPELLLSGTNRSGKPGGITAVHWVGFPIGYGWGQGSGTPSVGGRGPTPDGTTVFLASGSALSPRNNIRMTGSPDLHYVGACVVKMNGFAVIGRQTLRAADDWSMSNGFVTITPGVSASAIFAMQVQNPDGIGGAPTVTYEVEIGRFVSSTWTAGTDRTVTSLQVLRDSVEETVIRISGVVNLDGSGAPRNSFAMDLSLRRGALGVDVHYEFIEADNYGIGFVTPAAGGYSVITGATTGLFGTNNDADGMRPVLVYPGPGFFSFDDDLTNGRAYMSVFPYNAAEFFIGASNESATGSTARNLQDAYYSTVRATQRMVAP